MILAAAQHTTVVNQGMLSTTLGQVLAGLVVAIVAGIGATLIKAVRLAAKNAAASYYVLAGREPSPLEPNPPPGLVSISSGHTNSILDMAQHQLVQNGKVDKIQLMVASLVQSNATTHTDLGVAAVKVAEVAATQQHEVLAAIAEHEGHTH